MVHGTKRKIKGLLKIKTIVLLTVVFLLIKRGKEMSKTLQWKRIGEKDYDLVANDENYRTK